MVNRARQIAVLTRGRGGFNQGHVEWLREFEAVWGRPRWVQGMVWWRLRKIERRWRARGVELVGDIIDELFEKIKEDKNDGT